MGLNVHNQININSSTIKGHIIKDRFYLEHSALNDYSGISLEKLKEIADELKELYDIFEAKKIADALTNDEQTSNKTNSDDCTWCSSSDDTLDSLGFTIIKKR